MKKEKVKKEKVKKERTPGRGKKVWAVIGIIVLTLAVFAAGYYVGSTGLEITVAGSTSSDTQQGTQNGTDNQAVVGTDVTLADGETAAPEVTDASGEVITEAPVTKADGTVETDPLKFSKAQIIEYFNTAANKVRTGKPGFSKTTNEEYTFSSESAGDTAIGALNKIAQTAMDGPQTSKVEKGSDNSDSIASQSAEWASKLKPSDAQSAKITKDGENYKVSIRLIDNEINPQEGGNSAYSRFFDIDLPEEVVSKLSDSTVKTDTENLTVSYRGGYIDATIDKNGNIVAIDYGLVADLIMTNPKVAALFTLKDLTVITTWNGKYYDFVW